MEASSTRAAVDIVSMVIRQALVATTTDATAIMVAAVEEAVAMEAKGEAVAMEAKVVVATETEAEEAMGTEAEEAMGTEVEGMGTVGVITK